LFVSPPPCPGTFVCTSTTPSRSKGYINHRNIHKPRLVVHTEDFVINNITAYTTIPGKQKVGLIERRKTYVPDSMDFARELFQAALARTQGIAASDAACCVCFFVGACSLLTFILPSIYRCFLSPQNLKKKYDAEWALVTGGSSGIGRALVERLAKQGLNLIIAAMDDDLLVNTAKELQNDYPSIEVVPVPVNLGTDGYMEALDAVTAGKDVQIVFCNAGFMMTGFYTTKALGAQLVNYNCNITSHVKITHEYVRRMQASNLRGCVVFTGSPAGFLPSPFSVMYGSTKAFVTEFASSLSCEIRADGIDVSVVHPSPVGTRFYDKADKIDEIKFFMSTAATPDTLARALLTAPGNLVVYNQGYYPFVAQLLLILCDRAFLTEIMCRIAHTLGSYKEIKESGAVSGEKKKKGGEPGRKKKKKGRARSKQRK
jgi:short-subunit dehydrogenase